MAEEKDVNRYYVNPTMTMVAEHSILGTRLLESKGQEQMAEFYIFIPILRQKRVLRIFPLCTSCVYRR